MSSAMFTIRSAAVCTIWARWRAKKKPNLYRPALRSMRHRMSMASVGASLRIRTWTMRSAGRWRANRSVPSSSTVAVTERRCQRVPSIKYIHSDAFQPNWPRRRRSSPPHQKTRTTKQPLQTRSRHSLSSSKPPGRWDKARVDRAYSRKGLVSLEQRLTLSRGRLARSGRKALYSRKKNQGHRSKMRSSTSPLMAITRKAFPMENLVPRKGQRHRAHSGTGRRGALAVDAQFSESATTGHK